MTNNPVVLINTFEVPVAEEQAFLQQWEQARDVLMTQDGYLASQLHQSLDSGETACFVNVGTWASEPAFRRAIERPEFRSLELPSGFEEALYQVVRADQHWDADSAARRRAYAVARQ